MIAGQDEGGKTVEVGEKADRSLRDRILNLGVFKQVAGDYKRIHLPVAGNFKRTTQGSESRLAQFAGHLAELFEAST